MPFFLPQLLFALVATDLAISQRASAVPKPSHLYNALQGACSESQSLQEIFFHLDPISRVKLAKKLSVRHNRDISDYLTSCLVSPSEDFDAVHNDILVWVAQKGQLDVVVFLVGQKAADIHIHNDLPLRAAAQNGHLAVVKYLITQGANWHAAADSALIWSQENNHQAVSLYLLELDHLPAYASHPRQR